MIVERDDEFCVHKELDEGEAGEVIKCHPTRQAAADHMAALYAATQDEVKVTVKALPGDDWLLDVLGVPYGGPHGGKDAQGEYFTPDTELWLDKIPARPIVYFHGMDEDRAPEIIGREIGHERRADGVWFKVALDKTSRLARKVWEAAKQGLARASSGAIAHLVRTARDGRIEVWPIGELSLLDGREHQPANQYAIAIPAAKAIFAQAGIAFPAEATQEGKQAGAEGEQQSDPAITGIDGYRYLKLLALDEVYNDD